MMSATHPAPARRMLPAARPAFAAVLATLVGAGITGIVAPTALVAARADDGPALPAGAALRLGTPWLEGDGAAFSPTGHTLAVHSTRHAKVRFIDVATGALLTEVPGASTAGLPFVALWLPDLRVITLRGDGTEIVCWADPKTPAWTIRSQPLGKGEVAPPFGPVALSPDGALFAAARDGDRGIAIYEAPSGKAVRVLEAASGGDRWLDVVFSPDGAELAAVHDGGIGRWDVQSGKRLMDIPIESDQPLVAAAFPPDGMHAAIALPDATIRLYKIGSGEEVRRIESGVGADTLAFSSDGGSLIACRHPHRADIMVPPGEAAPPNPMVKGTLRMWDVASGKVKDGWWARPDVLRADGSQPQTIAASPDGEHLAVVDGDSVRLFAAASGKEAYATLPEAVAVGLGEDGILWAGPRTICSLDPKSGASRAEARVRITLAVTAGAAAYEDDGHPDMVVGSPGAPGKRLVFTSSLRGSRVVAFSPGARFVVAEVGSGAEVCEVASGKSLGCFDEMGYAPLCLAVTPDGTTAVIGGRDDHAIVLVDVATGKQRPLKRPGTECRALAFSADGALMAATLIVKGKGSQVFVWDARTWKGKWRFRVDDPGIEVVEMALSSDGKRLAAGDTGGSIRVWELETGEAAARFETGGKGVAAMAFSPDGKRLVSTGETATSGYIWDVP